MVSAVIIKAVDVWHNHVINFSINMLKIIISNKVVYVWCHHVITLIINFFFVKIMVSSWLIINSHWCVAPPCDYIYIFQNYSLNIDHRWAIPDRTTTFTLAIIQTLCGQNAALKLKFRQYPSIHSKVTYGLWPDYGDLSFIHESTIGTAYVVNPSIPFCLSFTMGLD